MLKTIDKFLNKITMYKIVLYYLMILWAIALGFSFFGLLPFTPVAMIISLAIITVVALASNIVFAEVFKVPANVESIYITAFILALIITPVVSATGYIFLGWVAIIAMASKYIFAIRHKHIFNPAAFAVAVTALTISGTASWWVGTLFMTPFVLIGGLLIVRKIKRADLTLAFFCTALPSILAFSLLGGGNLWSTLIRALINSPLLFFTFIMITEPLTTPPSRILQILYGSLVGLLFAPQVHFGSFYLTPETALLVGNMFSYLVSPKNRLTLKLKEVIAQTADTGEFIFESNRRIRFKPGQYLEWTLGHKSPDSRGNRRYFTIASSPTEKDLRLGVKFYPGASSFKNSLAEMNIGDTIIGSQLSGDFVMPRNKKKKLAFIAGGIGVTPFRSMAGYLKDSKEKRDIALIYAGATENDFAYRDFFENIKDTIGMSTIYLPTKPSSSWQGDSGYLTPVLIKERIPDFGERTFYISGPNAMVENYKKLLLDMGISNRDIRTDYFPGF